MVRNCCLYCKHWLQNKDSCNAFGLCIVTGEQAHSSHSCERYSNEPIILTEDLHVAGAKDDSVKPRTDLVLGGFSRALWEVSQVGTFGANKYTDNGWMEVPNGIERYLNALLRHYFKYRMGEAYDHESGLLHLSHLAWNALAVLELYRREGEVTVNG